MKVRPEAALNRVYMCIFFFIKRKIYIGGDNHAVDKTACNLSY